MLQPSCEQKEHLLASYMEAVRNHYEIVGLLNSVRHQPKTFRAVLGKAKVAHTQCGSGQVRIGTTLQSAQMLTGRFGAVSFYRLASAIQFNRPLPEDAYLDAFTQAVNVRVSSFGRVPKRFG